LIRPWAARLAGCDLSVGMLRQAKARRVYDVLHKAELVYYLDTQPGAFDLLTCADTLCYFGELQAVMHAARQALRAGGHFIFTVEALAQDDDTDHRLQPNGRYAHAQDYVRRTVHTASLELVDLAAVELRQEAGLPVRGWLATVGKPH
jgi:predicted TPR repeat methyltransferase